MNCHSPIATVVEEWRPFKERYYPRTSYYKDQPCDGCPHARQCAETGHECKAFTDWLDGPTNTPKPGRWQMADRIGP